MPSGLVGLAELLSTFHLSADILILEAFLSALRAGESFSRQDLISLSAEVLRREDLHPAQIDRLIVIQPSQVVAVL